MLTVSNVKDLYQGGKKPADFVQEIFNAIESDSKSAQPLNAFTSLSKDLAFQQAESVKSFEPPLAGIPIAIKDNINIEGELSTCGSKILSNYRAIYDAHVIAKLKNAGAIFIGKTNMDEFAMGSSNETSYFGPVLNPHDRSRVPGGSSGGSAVSVAAGFVPLALGSDTGGSIRQPASFCGITGFKPTYGRISRYGLIAYASSLDQIGPFAANVEDAALLYSVIAGHDPMDSTSLNQSTNFNLENIKKPIKGLKIGIPKEYFSEGIDQEVSQAVRKAIEILKSKGAEFKEVSLPNTESAIPVYYIIAPAEASSNLARFDGIRYGVREEADSLLDIYRKSRGKGFGKEVKRRIMIGTYVLSSGYYDAYYLGAQKARTLICKDFQNVFSQVDALITPTTPTTSFKIGEKTADPIQMYLSDIFTISANLAGIPALSLPAGKDSRGLPIGVQVMTSLLEEEKLFQVAYHIESGLK